MTDLERVEKAIGWLIFNKKVKNRRELAKKLDYTESSLSQIINKKVPLSDNFIKKLSITFNNISEGWLLTGEGEMLKNTAIAPKVVADKNYRMVPVYNFDAVGGMHNDNNIIDAPAYIEKYVPFVNARSEDICIHVTGNSMMPTYSAGSLLLVRRVDGWREYFGFGHVYVIFLKDGRRILKEVQKYDADPKEYILCVSHNKEYQAEELPKSIIVDVYKVIITLTNEGF